MADAKPAEANPEAIADVERAAAPPAAAAAAPPPAADPKPVTAASAVKTAAADVVDQISRASFAEQLALIAVMSAIELIQASVLRGQVVNSGWTNYAVSAGAVGFTLAATGFLLEAVAGVKFGENAQLLTASLLWAWWGAAAVALTFFGPFQSTCGYPAGYGFADTGSANGYFATWVAFLAASRLLADYQHKFVGFLKAGLTGTSQYAALNNVLCISSLIVMGAGIGPCSPQAACYTYNAFSVALGVVSAGLTLIFTLFKAAKEPNLTVRRHKATFLFTWWAVGTMVVTFGGPFFETSNGYFASYFSLFLSYAMLRSATV